ncbi:hypothetical protein EDB89DRAFT_1951954 [Lactarius sanguifluus]|nr:hypothetical protein EDB89DRAFT_1951954 [Lactarius sanguifluus]
MSGPIRLPQLPADILHAIVDELVVDFDSQNSDQWVRHQNRLRRIFYSKELLTLRLVCREFCHIVSPRIFRTLKLTHTLPSIRGFITMLRSPWVAPCVQSVKYQYWDPEPYRYETPADELEIHTAGTDAWSALTTPPLPPDLISPCEALLLAHPPALPPPRALALSFSDPVGVFYLSYNFADLFFPALRALRLQHVQFSAARDAEHLVTRHANTLLELHIAHCQIAVPQNGTENPQAAVAAAFAAARYSINNSTNGNPQPLPLPPPDDDAFDGWPVVPRPWSDIYTEFMNKLGRLVFLDVQDPWWLSFPDRYVTYSPSVVMQFLEDGREDDIRALEAFHRTVEERAKGLGIEYKPAIRIPDEDEFICDCH